MNSANHLQQKKSKLTERQSFHLGVFVLVGLIIWLVRILLSGQSLSGYWQDLSQSLIEMYGRDQRYLWLVRGMGITIEITLLAVSLGVVIGLVLSVIRVMHKAKMPVSWLNTLANLYITVIRGTPVTVQLFIIYFGVFASVNVNPVLIASLAFGINSGAYVAEIFRSGIESIDRGQMEAGRALGLTYMQTMRKIILPQAIKNVLPTLFNEVIALMKETAVAGYVGVTDLTRAAKDISSKTYSQNPLYVIALIYLAIVLFLTAALSRLERKLKRSDQR